MEKELIFKKNGLQINVVWDDGEIFYRHVLTNEKCESLQQIFAGWSEQKDEKSVKWDDLENLVEVFSFDFISDAEGDEFEIDFDIEIDENIKKLLEKKEITDEELEEIQENTDVRSCKYIGLEHGHAGSYAYHVVLMNDGEIYTVTTEDCE